MSDRTLGEIQTALRGVVDKWGNYAGTEKAGAQSFLNDLIAAYTGDAAMASGARFEEFGVRDEGAGYMDLYWPDVCIVEMKAPKESRRLDIHRVQALDYWRNSSDSATNTAAPPFLVLCSFRSFEVWEPGKYPAGPRDTFALEELPSRAEALMFLAGGKPVYGGPGAKVTRDAAQHMVDLYFRLLERNAAPPEELRRFVVQTVWVLFAEDVGLIRERAFESLLRSLGDDPTRNTAAELGDLLRRLNVPDQEKRNRGRAIPVPYVNGALFAETPDVALEPAEVEHLLAASEYDWQWVNPTVFGSLMEGCLGHDHRWELGAHYTSEEDILSIVRPVIVRPWLERIEHTTDINEALHLLNEFVAFRVLDPAMGCANFLAIAYRELRAIERQLHAHVKDLHEAAGLLPPIMPLYPITNLYGIEIDPFAVQIAKATLWMTHALIARQYGAAEPPLPLPSLDHLVWADSLKADWPEVDAIIGNPPFHGDKRLRSVVGDEYIEWLKSEFGVGVKDHCVYFFRKAHQHLKDGQRAGLVATNTVSQTKNRDASLGWITENNGAIVESVASKPWSGDAKVHVSIVCWKRGTAAGPMLLDGVQVDGISPSLRAGSEDRQPQRLAMHEGVVSMGYTLGAPGFQLSLDEARYLRDLHDARYSDVVVPLINGEDIVSRVGSSPGRWVIDFGQRALEEAEQFPEALSHVRSRVKPEREMAAQQNPTKRYQDLAAKWWLFERPRPKLRRGLRSVSRIIVAPMTGKRWLPVWGETEWRASNTTLVFLLDDDYSMGILSSAAHSRWAWRHASTLKGDLRYGTASCFDTFPWPRGVKAEDAVAVAEASVSVMSERARATQSLGKGLTAVYNAMDDGAFGDLRAAHLALDKAVLSAYGLPLSLVDDEPALLDALLDLNDAAAVDPDYHPFGP
jgi:hypothetical protein